MSQSSETKKFLNGFDYLLMPFVIAVGLAALFQGVFSQIYFFSDLLTNEYCFLRLYWLPTYGSG